MEALPQVSALAVEKLSLHGASSAFGATSSITSFSSYFHALHQHLMQLINDLQCMRHRESSFWDHFVELSLALLLIQFIFDSSSSSSSLATCDVSEAYSAVPLRIASALGSPLGSVNGSPRLHPLTEYSKYLHSLWLSIPSARNTFDVLPQVPLTGYSLQYLWLASYIYICLCTTHTL